MPAPKNPNTEAARAQRAANARQRKIDAAVSLLHSSGEIVITRDDMAKLLADPFYAEHGFSVAWMRGYFKIPEEDSYGPGGPQCLAEDSTGLSCGGPDGHPDDHANANGAWPMSSEQHG